MTSQPKITTVTTGINNIDARKNSLRSPKTHPNPPIAPLRVILYSYSNSPSLKLDRQRTNRTLRNFAKERGWHIVGEVYESASYPRTCCRPMRDQVIATIVAGKADGILCRNISSLFRSMEQAVPFYEQLMAGKIKFVQTLYGRYDAGTRFFPNQKPGYSSGAMHDRL